MRISELAGRRVAILGAGREGLAAWRAIRRRFPRQDLWLLTERAPAGGALPDLDERCDHLVVAPFEAGALEGFEVLVRSPGVSLYRPALRRAAEDGARVTTGTNLWFAEHPGERTICVTGTKGKSTTVALLAHLLRAAGAEAVAAGNIGRPLLDCEGMEASWWVVELSSYQIADLDARPDVAVLLNLSEEHLDWHGDVARYQRDKLRLAGLADDGLVVANHRDPVLRRALADREAVAWFGVPDGFHVAEGGLYRGDAPVLTPADSPLRGRHNLENLAAALTVLRAIGVDAGPLAKALQGFEPLAHRLQPVGERDGVRYVDDSISTTPVSTLAALEACAGSPVVLLVGGLDRGLDWRAFARAVRAAPPRAIIGMPDSGAAVIDCLAAEGVAPEAGLHRAEGLEAAVRLAARLAVHGGTVLLSPGAPSFPRFRDYRERGEAFARAAGFTVGGS